MVHDTYFMINKHIKAFFKCTKLNLKYILLLLFAEECTYQLIKLCNKGKMPQRRDPKSKSDPLTQSKQDFGFLAEAEGITLHQAGCSKRGCFLSIASLQGCNGAGTPCQQRAIARGQCTGEEGSILHKSGSLTKFIA